MASRTSHMLVLNCSFLSHSRSVKRVCWWLPC